MGLSFKQLSVLAASGSAALLLAAFAFQAAGYAPCAMCIWQRYPHAASIAAGVLIFFGFWPLLLTLIGASATIVTSGIGIYHTGVERDWWEGPSSCTGSGLDLSILSPSDLLPGSSNSPTNLVMCDEVVWEFLTLSMASWNAALSALLAVLWIIAIKKIGRNFDPAASTNVV